MANKKVVSIEETIREFVENECKKPGSSYGYDVFPFHFVPTVKYARMLMDKLGGDEEVVLLSAWMHDVGSIRHGRENHHVTGAKIAGEKLKELGYPNEKIELIKRCILNHRRSGDKERNTIEEQIIAEADALSHFDDFPGLIIAAFIYEGKTRMKTRISVKKKLERDWEQLHFDISREIIKPKFEAAMLLLS